MGTPQRLRGPTLVAAPLLVIALMGGSFALALGLWALWNPGELGVSFWLPFLIGVVIAAVGVVTSRGCFVDVVDGEVRDVVGWVRLQRLDQHHITAARVRLGVWRWYELEMDDGTRRTLLGTSPAQFPSRLQPGSDDRDLADLDVLMGPDRTDGTAETEGGRV